MQDARRNPEVMVNKFATVIGPIGEVLPGLGADKGYCQCGLYCDWLGNSSSGVETGWYIDRDTGRGAKINAVNHLNIFKPDYIKMDVDGIEHLILRGGQPLLQQVQSILIEINDEFIEQSKEPTVYLNEAGLSMIAKRYSEMVEEISFKNTFNQIWSRSINNE